MSVAERTSATGPRPAGAAVVARGVGIRFAFDRRNRVLTRTLSRVRRVRAHAWGVRDVDLDLGPGTGLALVGPSGSGKTTLLRLLAGVLEHDHGELETRGRVGALLATEAGVGGLLTGRENAQLLAVLAGLSLAEARAELETIAVRAKLGDAFERPVHTYSEGMRARLHLAVIQAAAVELLLVDEIFEALDHEFRAYFEEYARELRAAGGIVVAAGHDHAALARICPSGLLLDRGLARAAGPFEEVIHAYRG